MVNQALRQYILTTGSTKMGLPFFSSPERGKKVSMWRDGRSCGKTRLGTLEPSKFRANGLPTGLSTNNHLLIPSDSTVSRKHRRTSCNHSEHQRRHIRRTFNQGTPFKPEDLLDIFVLVCVCVCLDSNLGSASHMRHPSSFLVEFGGNYCSFFFNPVSDLLWAVQ